MARDPADVLKPVDAITAARIVTGYELAAGLALLAFAVLIPILAALWWGRPGTFAEFTSVIFLGIYMFAVISTFAIVVLWGLGRLDITESFMKWLGVATIGEVAGLLAYVLKQIFATCSP
ncbi:MAG TPA: hypothetical protein VJ180_12820 [Pyrinomonadaceae bacterium]|nr:hypothetical protein [Pyrinomonadaceae bacterium]